MLTALCLFLTALSSPLVLADVANDISRVDPPASGHWPAGQDAAIQPPPDSTPQTPPPAREVASIRLAADTRAIKPGETFHLAVIFELAPHWHIYWLHPGDSGAATEIDVTAPEGFEVGPALFPRPSIFHEPAGKTYGYEEQAVLLIPVTAPKELSASKASFSANIFYFICRDICLMDTVEREIELEVARDVSRPLEPARTADDELLALSRARLPRDIEEFEGARMQVERGRVIVSGPLGEHETIQFFPVHTEDLRFREPRFETSGDRFVLSIGIDRQGSAGGREEARGLIGLGREPDAPAYWFTLPPAAEKEGAS